MLKKIVLDLFKPEEGKYKIDYYDRKQVKTIEKLLNKEAYNKLIECYEDLRNGKIIGVKQEENYKEYKSFIDSENLIDTYSDELLKKLQYKKRPENTVRYEIEIWRHFKIDHSGDEIRSVYNFDFLVYDVCEETKTIYIKAISPRESVVQSIKKDDKYEYYI